MSFARSAPKTECFDDRHEAGRRLAKALTAFAPLRPVILALPRGGVPVGYEVAQALKAPLQPFVIRKLGAPFQRELGIGAIAQGGMKLLNHDLIRRLKISEAEISVVETAEREVLQERLALYGVSDAAPDVRNKFVIVVDDGLATGISMQVAVEALKNLLPAKITVAVPVGSQQAVAMLCCIADEVVCLSIPEAFNAVGEFYEVFDQVSDQDVIRLLHSSQSVG